MTAAAVEAVDLEEVARGKVVFREEEREMSQRRRGGWDEVGRAILCLHIAIWYGVRDTRT